MSWECPNCLNRVDFIRHTIRTEVIRILRGDPGEEDIVVTMSDEQTTEVECKECGAVVG